MKKALSYSALALLLVASTGFVVIGDLFQDEDEKSKAHLGVYLGEVTDKVAKKYELESTGGALVSMVMPGSAAARAGLLRGDVIVAVDGTPVADVESLSEMIVARNPGDIIDITVVRNGRRQTLAAELTERKEFALRVVPEAFALGKTTPRVYILGEKDGDYRVFFGSRYHLGISYQELNKGLGEYFDRPDGDGVLVTNVEEDSAAAKAGLRAGDVIIAIDGDKVADSGALMEALCAKDDDDEAETRTFQVEIIRRGQPMTLTLEAKRTSGYDYHYKIEREDIDRKLKSLRERLKQHKGLKILPRHLHERYIMAIPEIEILEDQIDVMIPDVDLMMHDIEMMIPDLDMLVPDLELMLPHMDEDLLDWRDFGDTHISLELLPDGSVIFNGEKFDSIEKFKQYIDTKKPKREKKAKQDLALAA